MLRSIGRESLIIILPNIKILIIVMLILRGLLEILIKMIRTTQRGRMKKLTIGLRVEKRMRIMMMLFRTVVMKYILMTLMKDKFIYIMLNRKLIPILTTILLKNSNYLIYHRVNITFKLKSFNLLVRIIIVMWLKIRIGKMKVKDSQKNKV